MHHNTGFHSSTRTAYDLHIHLDTHSGRRYDAEDYLVSLLEAGIGIAGFVCHDTCAPRGDTGTIRALFGAEVRLVPACRPPKGAAYLLGHAPQGIGFEEALVMAADAGVAILAHPFSTCPAPKAAWDGILKTAQREGVAMEWNAAYGGPERFYTEARRRGIAVTFGSDAHGPHGISQDIPSFVSPFHELSFLAEGAT
ncbi:MAG: hypothetical protein KO463_03080 [Candidatus Methanofastidiosa archaeon]|nr:hypothetical protein [Candidatus Methanofastidiosa archaeon]